MPTPKRAGPVAEGRTQRPIVALNRPQAVPLPGALTVPLEHIESDPEQPRRNWAHNDGIRRLEELSASIREFGILQPLLVRELEDTAGPARYRVVAGARRLEAARQAGLTHVPIVIQAADMLLVRELQLTENLQRQDLDPVDEARGFKELMDLRGLSPAALAERLHCSKQHVKDRLRLLADQILADAVVRRQISASVAREILKLPDDDLQEFRRRVEQGTRLQINDIAGARARLQADGGIHPRGGRPPRNRVQAWPDRVADNQPLEHAAADRVGRQTERADGAPTTSMPPTSVAPLEGNGITAGAMPQARELVAPRAPGDPGQQSVTDAAAGVRLGSLELAAMLDPLFAQLPAADRARLLDMELPRERLRQVLQRDLDRLRQG